MRDVNEDCEETTNQEQFARLPRNFLLDKSYSSSIMITTLRFSDRSNAKMNTSEMFSASGPENESVRVMAELGTFDRGWDLVTTLSYLVMSLSKLTQHFTLKQRKD